MFTSRAHKAWVEGRLILKLLKIPLLQICSFYCTNTCLHANIPLSCNPCLTVVVMLVQRSICTCLSLLCSCSRVAWYILRTHDATCHIALSKINPTVCRPTASPPRPALRVPWPQRRPATMPTKAQLWLGHRS